MTISSVKNWSMILLTQHIAEGQYQVWPLNLYKLAHALEFIFVSIHGFTATVIGYTYLKDRCNGRIT